jgi:hypothetical protein
VFFTSVNWRDVIIVEIEVNFELNARPEELVAAVEVFEDSVEFGGLENLLEETPGRKVLGLHLLERDDELL